MLEEEAKLIRGVLDSVLPNIVYLNGLRETVEREISRSESIEAFMEQMKKAISTEPDNTKKTDWQIFLNELKRRNSMR